MRRHSSVPPEQRQVNCKYCGKAFARKTSDATCSLACRWARKQELDAAYLEANRERAKERAAAFYEEQRLRVLKQKRDRYRTDPAYRDKLKARRAREIRDYKKKDPEGYKKNCRSRYLKCTYKLSHEDYESLLADQGGVCAICGAERGVEARNDHLHVDHDHTTGEIRGLLCMLCNRGIGAFRDDFEIIKNALSYIKKSAKKRSRGNGHP